jgi:hypothetical protein
MSVPGSRDYFVVMLLSDNLIRQFNSEVQLEEHNSFK